MPDCPVICRSRAFIPTCGAVYWSDRIWGNNLRSTYAKHYADCPDFADSHEGSNERDVYMTFKLWQPWKRNKLTILDGHDVRVSAK